MGWKVSFLLAFETVLACGVDVIVDTFSDHLKSHRLLNRLKNQNVQPDRMWDVSAISTVGEEGTACLWLVKYHALKLMVELKWRVLL